MCTFQSGWVIIQHLSLRHFLVHGNVKQQNVTHVSVLRWEFLGRFGATVTGNLNGYHAGQYFWVKVFVKNFCLISFVHCTYEGQSLLRLFCLMWFSHCTMVQFISFIVLYKMYSISFNHITYLDMMKVCIVTHLKHLIESLWTRITQKY